MKTSATQFEMLVNFMEQNGDVHKPTKNACGRMQAINYWENLTNLLNADPTGESKTTEKWKKVWSDLKNNTKKKAAKINRAASGTGGGPALNARLSELEQRILNIIGNQAATGLVAVIEAGFSEESNAIADVDCTVTLPSTSSILTVPVSPTILTGPDENINIIVSDDTDDVWNQPGPSHQPFVTPSPVQSSPTRPPSPVQPPLLSQNDIPPSPLPASSCNLDPRRCTPRRRRGITVRRNLLSPRRPRTQSHVELAAQHFLNADVEWRNFVIKQHEDNREIELKKLKLQERELETQSRWQDITIMAITALNNIIDRHFQT